MSTPLSGLYLKERFYPFEEANMTHFDIDGPRGEVVAEVHVSDGQVSDRLGERVPLGRGLYYWGWFACSEDGQGGIYFGLDLLFWGDEWLE